MNRKKVLLISPLPPPVGGIASWTLHLLEYFSKSKGEYSVVHFNSAIKSKRITDSRFFIRIYSGILDFTFLIKKLRKVIKEQKPDVVHLTSSASLALFKDFAIALLLWRRKIKSVIHLRFGRIPSLARKKNWEWVLLKFVVNLFDDVIVLDKASYKIIKSEVRQNGLHLLPNPVAEKIKNNYGNFYSDERSASTILFVGHITRKKGVYELVESVSKIKEIVQIKLLGPVEPEVERGLNSIAGGSTNLIFMGSCSQEEVLTQMGQCGIFILPSHTEGFPNVIIEAMALGCPIIATEVGAIPDLLEYDRGICIPIKSTTKLEQAVRFYLNNPSKAKEFGHNAQAYALENFKIENIVTRIENIWFAK